MTILFIGSEPESFTYTGTPDFDTSVGSPARYQATHQRGAHSCDHQEYLNVPNFGAQTEIWLRYYHAAPANNNDGNQGIVRFFDNAGNERFRIERSGDTAMQARYWNGSGFTNIGGATSTYYNYYGYVDVHLVVNSESGLFEIYQNGSLVDSGSADFSSISDIASLSFGRGAGTGSVSTRLHVSEVIVLTTSTLGHQLYTRPPTSDGNETDWTGDYEDVDEAAIDDDDFIQAGNDQDISTFAGAGATLPNNLEVKAVAITARCKSDGSAPSGLQGVLRIGSNNYTSASAEALSSSYEVRQFLFENDPSTDNPWEIEDAGDASLEFGVKAVS